MVNNPPANAEDTRPSLAQEYPLEEGTETHRGFLPGEFYGKRSLVGYHQWGSKRVGHYLVTKQQ